MGRQIEHTYPLNYVTNQLNSIISDMLNEYSEELQDKADKVTEAVVQDFASKLKDVTPRSDGGDIHMADTVTVVTKSEQSLGRKTKARYVCYKKWQISHLLEFGWTLKNGQRMERQPFVRPLFDQNKDKYVTMYKEELSK